MSKKRLESIRPPPSRRRAPSDPRPKNRILAALPAEDFKRILPDLTTMPLTRRNVFQKRGEPMRYVFFPNGGVCSVTSMMTNGTAVEVATVGDEGMLGITALWGGRSMPGETMCQVQDTSVERMPLDAFVREIERRGALYESVGRYSQGALALMMQSTACMALHDVQARCCRWLLMTHDRVRTDEFHLSHEFLAMMLGSTRPTVSTVAGLLQRAGLIRYTHAKITIVDRKGLKAASCECYATIRAEFARLRL